MQKALLTSKKEASQPARERLFRRVLWSLFFLFLFPTYWALIRFHYTVSPGADTFVHLQAVAENRLHPLAWIYPPKPELFQALIAFLANTVHLPVTQTYAWLAALALPLSSVTLAFLARELFGRRVGLLTAVLSMFICLQPWQTYADGTLPNIIAIGILFPLALLWCARAWNRTGNERVQAVVFSSLLLITILYTHHLSTLITLVVVLFAGAIAVIYRALTAATWRARIIPLIAYLAVLIATVYLFLSAPFLAPARSIFTVFLDIQKSWPFLTVIPSVDAHPWNSFLFGQDLGGGIIQLASLGVVVAAYTLLKPGKNRLGSLIVVCWFIVYFIGATVTWSGEPTRMARDLALPGCILAAYAINWAYLWLKSIQPQIAIAFAGGLLMITLPYVPHKIEAMTSESSLHYFQDIDERAYTELTKANQLNETTIVSPNFFWQAVLTARQPHLDPIPSAILVQAIPADTVTHSRCIMVVEYKQPVLSPTATPDDYAVIVMGRTYSPIEVLENPARRISFACRETVAHTAPTIAGQMSLAAR